MRDSQASSSGRVCQGFRAVSGHRRVSPGGSLSSEQVSDLTCQFIGKKGLFQTSAALQYRLALLDYLLGVARHEKEFHILAQGRDSQFRTRGSSAGADVVVM